MITTRRIDVFYNLFARLLKSSINLISLPLLLTTFDSTTLGVYFYIISIIGLSLTIEFGLGGVIIRLISNTFTGNYQLKSEGYVYDDSDKNINLKIYNNLQNLLFIAKKVYRKMTILLFVILISLGSFSYFNFSNDYSIKSIMIWIFTIVSILETLYMSRWHMYLYGIGKSYLASTSILISKIIYLTILIVLINSIDLFYLTLIIYSTGFIERLLCKYFFNYHIKKTLYKNEQDNSEIQIFRMQNEHSNLDESYVIEQTLKNGLNFVNTVILFNLGSVIIANFVSQNEFANYGLTMQFINLLVTLSSIFFSTYSPKIIEHSNKKNYKMKYEIFFNILILEFIVMTIGTFSLITFKDLIFRFIKSDANLIENNFILLIAVVILLDNLVQRLLFLFQIKNIYPQNKSYLITSILIILTTILLLNFTNFGIISFYLSILIFRGLGNYIFWIYKTIKLIVFKELVL
jgi:O-antigen/teichoic acid export membrane protein